MRADISRTGSLVTIRVGPTPSDPNRLYAFNFDCGNEDHAELMMRYLRDGIFKVLESERRQYYNLGHKHGRAKRRKESWFSGCLKETNP